MSARKSTTPTGRQRVRTHITPDRMIPYEDRPSEYHGVLVVHRQRSLIAHPNPSQGGRLVPTAGVTHVLLENDHEFHECDICLHSAPNPRSVLSHLTSHNPAKNAPVYPADVLRKIILVCAYERDRGLRGYVHRAAAELNRLGIKPISGGDDWTPAALGSAFNRYHKVAEYAPTARQLAMYRRSRELADRPAHAERRSTVRQTRPADPPVPVATDATETADRPIRIKQTTDAAVETDSGRTPDQIIRSISYKQHQIRTYLDRIAADLAELTAQLAAVKTRPAVDPEVERKAAQFDAMMALARNQGEV